MTHRGPHEAGPSAIGGSSLHARDDEHLSGLRLLRLCTQFRFRVGEEWRELRDPAGEPSFRQLRRLNRLGALAVVEPGQVGPISKGQAAFAIGVLDDVDETEVEAA